MHEIVTAMQEIEPDIEEIDQWVNCHNIASTIPDWYDGVAEFKAAR